MADLAEMPTGYARASRGVMSAGWAAVIITLLLQSVLLAFYFGRIDERIQNLQSEVLQLKYEIRK